MTAEATPTQWVAELGPTAQKVGAQYRISPTGLMAVAALESGWGTSAIARACQNVCGLNGYPEVIADPVVKSLVDPAKPTVDHDTEQWNGQKMQLSAGEVFLNFPRRSNSLEVWARWVRGYFFPGKNNLYKTNQGDALDRAGFEKLLTNAVNAGWCPTPGYVGMVMKCYDRIAAASPVMSAPPVTRTPSSALADTLADLRALMERFDAHPELYGREQAPAVYLAVVRPVRGARDYLKGAVK